MKCLSCNTPNLRAVCITDDVAKPQHGYPVLCYHCGIFLILEYNERGLRSPTPGETTLIETNALCQSAVRAWIKLRAG
jgi:hypothetical protein